MNFETFKWILVKKPNNRARFNYCLWQLQTILIFFQLEIFIHALGILVEQNQRYYYSAIKSRYLENLRMKQTRLFIEIAPDSKIDFMCSWSLEKDYGIIDGTTYLQQSSFKKPFITKLWKSSGSNEFEIARLHLLFGFISRSSIISWTLNVGWGSDRRTLQFISSTGKQKNDWNEWKGDWTENISRRLNNKMNDFFIRLIHCETFRSMNAMKHFLKIKV